VTKGRWARKQPSVKECVIAHPWSYAAPKMCGTKVTHRHTRISVAILFYYRKETLNW